MYSCDEFVVDISQQKLQDVANSLKKRDVIDYKIIVQRSPHLSKLAAH